MDALASPEKSRRLKTVSVAVFSAVVAMTGTTLVLTDRGLMDSAIGRADPLLLLFAVLFGALAIRYSSLGLPILIVFVYLNLSEALVRYHDFPSLLQVLVVGLAFAAWLKRDTDDPREVMRQPLTIYLAGYLLLLLVTTTIAEDPELADQRVVEIAKAFIIFGLGTILMRNRKRLFQGIVAL
ncbi:MAG: hypothetical protein R3338_12320, partial [Thermoanaerobaculia bacterium]|nr:hypothetical protein [Thermoanaerobaculia bacterium]